MRKNCVRRLLKKTIYGYYDATNRLNGEDLFSYLALDGELKEGTEQSAINLLQKQLDQIEEEILVEKYTLLESDKNKAKVKVTLRLTESNRAIDIVSKLVLEDNPWKIKSGKWYDLIIKK